MNNRILLMVAACMLWRGVVCAAPQPAHNVSRFPVRDFGAIGDGTTLDTRAVQRALDACGKAGGGTVVFSKGTYLSGALFVKSNTTLRFERGSMLEGSSKLDDYPMIESRWAGTHEKCYASLINVSNAKNITITGKGTIAGSGAGSSRPPAGPRVIELMKCKDIRIENITVTNKGRWTIHPIYCTNVVITGVTVRTTGLNADGCNPDSCNHVIISKCSFKTGDDCIAIKSGKNREAIDIGIPCENVTITDCEMLGGHGAVVIGSELSGGVRNVVVSNCVCRDLRMGIRIKTRRGRGGVVEKVRVSGIRILNTPEPLVVNMNYPSNAGDLITGKAGLTVFKDITIKDVTIQGETMGFIRGLEDCPVENMTLENISATGSGRLVIEYVRGLKIRKVTNNTSDNAVRMHHVSLAEE